MSMSLRAIAQAVGQGIGSNPALPYAHFAGESGHGSSDLAVNYHNYAGFGTTSDDPNRVWTTDNGGSWKKTFRSDEDFVRYAINILGNGNPSSHWNVGGIQDWDTYVWKLFKGQGNGSAYGGDTGYQHYLGWGSLVDAYNNGAGEDEGNNPDSPDISAYDSSSSSAPSSAGVISDDGVSSTEIDWSVWTHNHGGEDSPDNIRDSNASQYSMRVKTDTKDLQPVTYHGANLIGQHFAAYHPMITAGAETWIHKGGEHSHHAGYKIDMWMDGATPGTELGDELVNFCESRGWNINYEVNDDGSNAHWDINFSGDTTLVQRGQNPNKVSGDIFGDVYTNQVADRVSSGRYIPNVEPEMLYNPTQPMGVLEALWTNFVDSELDVGGILNTAISLWGMAAHSGGERKELTQADEKYIKTALAGDTQAQEFVLMNAVDSEHAQYLVQQKQEEYQRKAAIEEWKAGNQGTLARLAVGVGGLAGYVLDPTMLVPALGALTKLKMARRLGDGLLNVVKAEQIGNMTISGYLNSSERVAQKALMREMGYTEATLLDSGEDIARLGSGMRAPARYTGGVPSVSDYKNVAQTTKEYKQLTGGKNLVVSPQEPRMRSAGYWDTDWDASRFASKRGLPQGRHYPATTSSALRTVATDRADAPLVAYLEDALQVSSRPHPHTMKYGGYWDTDWDASQFASKRGLPSGGQIVENTAGMQGARVSAHVAQTARALSQGSQVPLLPSATESATERTLGEAFNSHDILATALKTGLTAGISGFEDDALLDASTDKTVNYGMDAMGAFLVGSALGALGGKLVSKSKSTPAKLTAAKLEQTESRIYAHASGKETLRQMNAPKTMHIMSPLHDTTYGETLKGKSKLYDRMAQSGRVFAMTSNKARKAIRDAGGEDLPSEARAFFSPNEDYIVLLTDKLKPEEVDNVLVHEFTHEGLKSLMGEKAYSALLNEIRQGRKNKKTDWAKASKKYGTTDPEEIIAYVLQDEAYRIPDKTLKRILDRINGNFKGRGIDYRYTKEELQEELIQNMMLKAQKQTTVPRGADGKAIPFSDIQFAKENVGNMENIMAYGTLERPITDEIEKDLKKPWIVRHIPFAKRFATWAGKKVENGYIGEALESASKTMRSYGVKLFNDSRGRGLGDVGSITAEDNMLRISSRLNTYLYDELAPLETKWMGHFKIHKQAADQQWWHMLTNAYDAKYGGHTSNVMKDVPEEVNQAVEVLNRFFKEEEMIGRHSADDVGSSAKNMIEEDWYAVDHEMPRISNDELKAKFLRENYVNTHDKTILQQAKEDMKKYIYMAAKRRGDVNDPLKSNSIEGQILREKKMRNAKIRRYNETHKKPKQEIKETVTDAEIEEYLKEHVDNTVDMWLGDYTFDPTAKTGVLGSVPWFKHRVPVDTSFSMKLSNGTEFSFDNNLRSYNYNQYFARRIRRFAGELSVRNVFGTEQGLRLKHKQVNEELQRAYRDGVISQSEATSQLRNWDRMINELRGVRTADDTVRGKMDVIGRIIRQWAYFKNGANMGLNQLGEISGSIAYGGVSQMFSFFKPLQKLVDDIRFGKVSSDVLEEMEHYNFGTSIEYQMFPHSYIDSTARNVLTQDTIANKLLIGASEATQRLTRVTTLLNMLPKTTEWMVRSMRKQTIADTIDWAKGKKFSVVRNPFTKAKLKAAHVSDADVIKIKNNINEFAKYDKGGHLIEFDINGWKAKDMDSYLKWYTMIQLQSERAITPVYRLGNMNLAKNNHGIVPQLLLQFKDYSLRSMNAQTMRALTARNLDDAIAAGLSIITNTGVYATRVGIMYGLYNALGMHEQAEKYYDKMFGEDMLKRAIATRSTFVGTPLSFLNDAYELWSGDDTVRSTVQRQKTKSKQDRTVGDIAKDAVAQIPAIQATVDPTMAAAYAVARSVEGKSKSKDTANLLKLMPVPNWFPVTALMKYLSQQ